MGHRGHWDPAVGAPRSLRLGQAVRITVMYLKNNLTQEVLAELHNVSQPTISRTITELEPLITDVLAEFVPNPRPGDFDDLVTIIDGTLIPCWSWADAPELYSGKHKTTGHNHQIVVDLHGRLLHISQPLPGHRHDTAAAREHALLGVDGAVLDPAATIADKGYLGTGALTPFRKPPGGELLDWHRRFNADLNRIRYVVERAIAHFKTWRSMHTDYRRPLRTYRAAFETVRALHFFKITW